MKTFVVVGAGELQIPLIKAAKNLGLHVIATDQNPNAVGFQHSDEFVIANTLNPQETLENLIAIQKPIHGVATAGTDASQTVATVAKHFDLPGHTIQATKNASNKALMRVVLEQAQVSIPRYKIIKDAQEALSFFEEIDSPCVLKPAINMGARGVSMVFSPEQVEEAFYLAQENNKDNIDLLIEEYIDAHELSIDALICDGVVTITGIGDRIIEHPPYFVETGHILPSNLDDEWIQRAVSTFRDGIKALGLTHGAAKGDIKISDSKAWVIEIAGRLSGGFMSSHTFPFATGINLHEQMVKLSLGEELPILTPTKNLVSVERAIILPPGIITEINIPENILEQEYITHFTFRAKVGNEVHPPKNNLDKQGNVIATAPTRALAIRAVNKAIMSINIQVENPPQGDILKNSTDNARTLLKKVCGVCKYCDGIWCKGQIPGLGGVGTGEGFTQAYDRYRQIKLIPHYIHEVRDADSSIEMFGHRHSMPVFVAPIGGAGANYDNAVSELELQRAFVKGALHAGTMAFTPDPASFEVFSSVTRAILENYGHSVIICKPRTDISDIILRYKLSSDVGVLGIGTDVDGIGLRTFKGSANCPKSIDEIKTLIQSHNLPFVVKGVLSISDAKKAIEAGATHIVVSSHGGRIGESFPMPIDMLPKIKEVVGDDVQILIDGAIRSGSDVIKALLLGADAVLIGRPVATHAVGGGYRAVTEYLNTIKNQLQSQMLLLGVSNIEELKQNADVLLLEQDKLYK